MTRRLHLNRHALSFRRRTLALGALLCLLVPLVALLLVCGLRPGGQHQEAAAWPSATETPESEWTKFIATPSAEMPVSLTASASDASGVAINSDFVLKASIDVDESALRQGMTVEPPVTFDVKKSGDREFHLVPQQPLKEETLYHFKLTLPQAGQGSMSRSWAFQTKTPLRIVQTLPAQSATDVPLNTGIELTFTYDGVNDVTPFLEITPPTAGRVEVHKRVVIFVPESLQADTLYTVTVRKGLGIANSALTMNDDFSFQFETGETGRTGQTPGMAGLVFKSRTTESSSSGAPALELAPSYYGSSTSNPPRMSFTVYQYPGLDAFAAALAEYEKIPAWAYHAKPAYLADTAGLSTALTFDAQPETLSAYGGDFFVRVPVPLSPGFYLVEANGEEGRFQGWLQVTDVAVHATVSGKTTLVWVNDVAAHGPIAGAKVALVDGTPLATTDDKGVAFFDTPASLIENEAGWYGEGGVRASQDLLVTDTLGRQMLVPLGETADPGRSGSFYFYPYTSENDLYWNYLSMDRPLYQPSDTIHFWGVLKSREGGGTGGQQATVELSGGRGDYSDYYGFNDRSVPLASADVTRDDMGGFTGDLAFADAAPGYYQLNLKVGDKVITTQYFEIRNYTKPAYKIDVTPSKKAVFAGDRVDFNIDVAFFDGSPVPNAELAYTSDGGNSNISGETKTDDRGHAIVALPAFAPMDIQGQQTLNVRPKAAEEGEITGSAWVEVFRSALTIEPKTSNGDGAAVVSGVVRNVDLDHLDLDRPIYDYRNANLGPPAPGRSVNIEVFDEFYTAVKTGETYDFIEKMVVPLYQYDVNEVSLGQSTVTTLASGAFSYRFPADPSKRYRLVLTSEDDQGRTAEVDVWVNTDIGTIYAQANARPRLVTVGGDSCPEDYFPYSGQAGFDIGQQVDMVMKHGAEAAPSGGANRYLYLQAQNGIRDYEVQESSELTFAFPDRYVPNVTVFGVWFTGETYESVDYGCNLRANTASKRLQVEVTPAQERYQPGDEATLNVSVHDSDGQPARAEVNLSAVDEAIFRILPPYESANKRDILADLYSAVGHGLIVSYASHQYPGGISGGGKGGGGSPRSDFEDVALFKTVMTDDQGQASVSFKLPDNLTSWRVIAQGVTSDLKAGGTTSLLPVGLPFFVDLSMNDEYLTSDKPQIRLRAFGEGLSEGTDVSFEVTCPSLGIDEPIQASGPAFQPVDVALPDLVEGEHELTVKVTAGDLSDSLTRKFRVVQSRLLRAESQFYELTPDLAIAGSADGRTNVVFTDNNRGRYYPLLLQLSWTYGDRVDQMLARNLSQDLLKQYFGEDQAAPAVFDTASYQTPKGGIALFPYADADLTLSARLAALAPDSFARNSLVSYFTSVVDDKNESRERTIIALYGLAALGEPVLPELGALAAQPDLTWRERLYLGLASLAAGDEDGARRIYRGLLADFGERKLPYLRLRVGTDQDDILEATSLAAILGGGLGDDSASRLFDYTRSNYTKDILVELEQVSYLENALPRLSGQPVRFAYWLDGKRHEDSLERGASLSMSLTPEQLRDLRPEPLQGEVGIASFYLATFQPDAVQVDSDISVSRRFELSVEPGNVYHDDSLVRVVIDWSLSAQALDGCYQVSDLLPSGLKPITRYAAWGGFAGAYQVDGQRVNFCVWKSSPQTPIVYYARVVGKGDYTAEPAIIQSMRSSDSLNLTAPDRVQVR